MSIECLLDILSENRIEGQTVQKWKEQMEERLKTPNLSVSNYGGGAVNIISQMSVTLTHGKNFSVGANGCFLRTTPGN